MTKSPLSFRLKPPTSFPVLGLNDDVRALHAAAAFGDAPADAAERPRERRRPIDVGDASDVVGLEGAIGNVAASERDWKHDGFGRDDAAPARDEFGLSSAECDKPSRCPISWSAIDSTS